MYSLVQWNWFSAVTRCTWVVCIQWRQRTNFTAPGCMHSCVCNCACVRASVCVCVCVCLFLCPSVCLSVYVSLCVRACACVCVCASMRARVNHQLWPIERVHLRGRVRVRQQQSTIGAKSVAKTWKFVVFIFFRDYEPIFYLCKILF